MITAILIGILVFVGLFLLSKHCIDSAVKVPCSLCHEMTLPEDLDLRDGAIYICKSCSRSFLDRLHREIDQRGSAKVGCILFYLSLCIWVFGCAVLLR